ncbi:peptidylprolyl isomerase [Sandarakinorhabdus sp.]|uniref:peptidylprolyl isomerase n=1 Tax=Sandarakinorhabdus sp. TaxID=1916663 RepID=UPI00286E5BFB|nr:peptidylprolyl isomerase [Sandarakinorhabdus sp.]
MKKLLPLAALVLMGQAPPPSLVTPTSDEILAKAPAAHWIAINPDDLMVMDSAAGRMVIQLAPDFAPAHVAAIKALVRAGRFDDGRIVRVQDNYVVQWAAKPGAGQEPVSQPPDVREQRVRASPLPAEYERPIKGLSFKRLPFADAYAKAGFVAGWPAARDRKAGTVWLTHCYATVGVGRDMPPDTGDGSELYTVIGHGPRHLDRNITNVGRVIAGIEPHAALPRGTEALGFYKDEAARTRITQVRMASDMPGFARWQMLDTDSRTFADWMGSRANRTGFFVRPAGAADLCNLRVPVRETR